MYDQVLLNPNAGCTNERMHCAMCSVQCASNRVEHATQLCAASHGRDKKVRTQTTPRVRTETLANAVFSQFRRTNRENRVCVYVNVDNETLEILHVGTTSYKHPPYPCSDAENARVCMPNMHRNELISAAFMLACTTE